MAEYSWNTPCIWQSNAICIQASHDPDSCLNHHHVGHALRYYLLWKQYLQFSPHSAFRDFNCNSCTGLGFKGCRMKDAMQKHVCNSAHMQFLSNTRHVCLIVTEISQSRILLFSYSSGLPSGPNRMGTWQTTCILLASWLYYSPVYSYVFSMFILFIFVLE